MKKEEIKCFFVSCTEKQQETVTYKVKATSVSEAEKLVEKFRNVDGYDFKCDYPGDLEVTSFKVNSVEEISESLYNERSND